MRSLMILVLLLTGCGATHKLDGQYQPLEQIRESVLRPGEAITTVGTTSYVSDLDEWLTKHPPGGPMYHAILMHEREHSIRQKAYGTKSWVGRYLIDKDFMWAEEARGWYIQLKEYQRAGLQVNVPGVAKALSDYRNFAGSMISYQNALTWVQDVLAGRWTPPEE
ncbi:MAG: hypothetical protein AB7L09_00100 [Nitrospira sp.]